MFSQLSLLVTYHDDEDRVAVTHRELSLLANKINLAIEIVPVDIGSGDNSNAMWQLLAAGNHSDSACFVHEPVGIARSSILGAALHTARGMVAGLVDIRRGAKPNLGIANLMTSIELLREQRVDLVRFEADFSLWNRTRCDIFAQQLGWTHFGLHGRLGRAALKAGRRVIAHSQHTSGLVAHSTPA